MTKLLRIAAQIGVADSARYLQKNTGLIGALASPGSYSGRTHSCTRWPRRSPIRRRRSAACTCSR